MHDLDMKKDPYMNAFGIQVSYEMVTSPAHVLSPPDLRSGDNVSLGVGKFVETKVLIGN